MLDNKYQQKCIENNWFKSLYVFFFVVYLDTNCARSGTLNPENTPGFLLACRGGGGIKSSVMPDEAVN